MSVLPWICAILLALQSSPRGADDWYALGVRLSAEGKPVEAIAAYRRSVELNPRQVDAWNNLGDLLRRSGDREGALAALDHALAIDPKHPRASLNAALTDIELHRFKEALPLRRPRQRRAARCEDADARDPGASPHLRLYRQECVATGREQHEA